MYRNVSAADLERLDAFEGAPYERRNVALIVAGREIPGGVYVIRDADCLEAFEWDVAAFARTGMREFIATYCAKRGV